MKIEDLVYLKINPLSFYNNTNLRQTPFWYDLRWLKLYGNSDQCMLLSRFGWIELSLCNYNIRV